MSFNLCFKYAFCYSLCLQSMCEYICILFKKKLGIRTREKENNSKSVELTSSLKEDALLTLAKSERNIKSKTFEAFALYLCKAFFFSFYFSHFHQNNACAFNH